MLDFISSADTEHRLYPQVRTGMMNVSFIPRDSDQDARNEFEEYDRQVQSREAFCAMLDSTLPKFEATIGGQVSVDVTRKGFDKRQVVPILRGLGYADRIFFFGDKMTPRGNDFALATRVTSERPDNRIFQVSNPTETFGVLRACVETGDV